MAKSSEGVTVPQNTTYAELVDILYDALEVDKSKYDLLLHVKYTAAGALEIPPTLIKRDRNVTFYLNEPSSPHHPLCVTLVEKPLYTNSTQESVVGAVPASQNDICQLDVIENPLPADQTPGFTSLLTNPTPGVFPGIDDHHLFPRFQPHVFDSHVFDSQAGEGPCFDLNQVDGDDWAAPIEPILNQRVSDCAAPIVSCH